MPQSTVSPPYRFIRDTIVSTLVLVGLYGLAQGVQFQPIQIPGYLLIVGFDALEGIFGAAGSNYYLLFALYVLGLGVIGAALSTVIRTQPREVEVSIWRVGVAGALTVTGLISLLFGGALLVGTSQLTPVLITGLVGIVLLVLAGWLAGLAGTSADRPE